MQHLGGRNTAPVSYFCDAKPINNKYGFTEQYTWVICWLLMVVLGVFVDEHKLSVSFPSLMSYLLPFCHYVRARFQWVCGDLYYTRWRRGHVSTTQVLHFMIGLMTDNSKSRYTGSSMAGLLRSERRSKCSYTLILQYSWYFSASKGPLLWYQSASKDPIFLCLSASKGSLFVYLSAFFNLWGVSPTYSRVCAPLWGYEPCGFDLCTSHLPSCIVSSGYQNDNITSYNNDIWIEFQIWKFSWIKLTE